MKDQRQYYITHHGVLASMRKEKEEKKDLYEELKKSTGLQPIMFSNQKCYGKINFGDSISNSVEKKERACPWTFLFFFVEQKPTKVLQRQMYEKISIA